MSDYEELMQRCYRSISKNNIDGLEKKVIKLWKFEFDTKVPYFEGGKKSYKYVHLIESPTLDKARKLMQIFVRNTVKGLKLNLGCGGNILPEFVNIDHNNILCDVEGSDIECQPDLIFNIGEEIYPFDNESVDIIWMCYVIEHLTMKQLFFCFEECYRVLKRGGLMAMAFPDFNNIKGLSSYKKGGEDKTFILQSLSNSCNADTGGEHQLILTRIIVQELLRCFGFIESEEVKNSGQFGVFRNYGPDESRIFAIKQ
jgi:predicted SAM-dependent methyltransferase